MREWQNWLITDLDDCAGKFVKVTLTGREYNGKTYLDLKSAEQCGAAKPIAPLRQEPTPVLTPPEAATIQESEEITVEKDILF